MRVITDVEALTALRIRAGLTMPALAARSGVSLSMVKQVHRGTRQLSLLTAAKIARALGCDPRDFTRPADRADAA